LLGVDVFGPPWPEKRKTVATIMYVVSKKIRGLRMGDSILKKVIKLIRCSYLDTVTANVRIVLKEPTVAAPKLMLTTSANWIFRV
ncbi:MAG: hypothetical protein P8R36_03125, partial [Actinomycetota bacterium]|nr:hypothetical protein [Actinomycetota bacterium]